MEWTALGQYYTFNTDRWRDSLETARYRKRLLVHKNLVLAEFWKQHGVLLGLVVCYFAVGGVVHSATGVQVLRVGGLVSALGAAGMMGALMVLITFLQFPLVFALSRIPTLIFGKSASTSTWADYRRHLTIERGLGIFTVWALLLLMMAQFLGFKAAIPDFHPFSWDVRLMNLDLILHGGRHPWKLLHPILGRPEITWAVDKVYIAWFSINFLFFHWMAWRRWDALRFRFFLSYALVWILLGSMVGTVLSSAGPVYYEAVVGDSEPYGLLVSYLQTVGQTHHLYATNLQQMLWAGYTGQLASEVEGISAMPSIHVALPVLLTLTAHRLHPRLGFIFGVYSLLILVGSIHLAWHYAVDGYASILAVPLIWGLSGWIARLARAG